MTAFFVLQVALDTKKTVREPSREYSLFFCKKAHCFVCDGTHARARTFNGDDEDDEEEDVGD